METVRNPAEQRVLLQNVSWETYERLLAEREERRAPRFFYDGGVLEISSPSAEHEGISYLIGVLIDVLAEELELDVFGTSHTTFKREDLGRGFEPDGSFYLSDNAGRVRGKANLDLDVDPPPDLVVEVDITSPSTDKFPIYARLGITEIWRHDGERLAIFTLRDGAEYAEVSESTLLPPATSEALTRFVEEGLTKSRPAWVHRVREWVRGAMS